MKTTASHAPTPRRRQLAYTLAEVLVAVAALGVMLVTLYGAMSQGFVVTQFSRENLRATQIMLERLEGIRLFNWNQLRYSNNLVERSFTNYYYPLATNGQSKGIPYYGTLTINTNVTLNPPATYSTNMALVTVSLVWTNSGVPRNRSMSTYSAYNGIQNYVYGFEY